MKRKLTGNWYIKRIVKRKWLPCLSTTDFVVMVEIICDNPFKFYPNVTRITYVEANPQDLITLNIHIH